MKNNPLRKRVGAMLVATGILSRGLALQTFAEKGFEITSEQYLILSLLVEHGELYQRQISELTYKDRPNVSRIINILEEKELVKRINSSNGRQIYKIVVTEKGRNLREIIHPVIVDIRKTITKGISKEELEICLQILEKMLDNMKDKVKLQI